MNKLSGKTIYAFGDSIIYGHTLPDKSFMRIIAEQSGADVSMYAVNGATVIAGSGNDIITQVENAPSKAPDIIVFDGYTNDAYERTADKVGAVTDGFDAELDGSTFCGNFERIVSTMKKKWADSKILFVTIHKSGGRKWDIQTLLYQKAVEICGKWGIEVADVFKECEFDTRDEKQMAELIIDGAGSHPNEIACKRFYVPLVSEKLEALCE